MRVMIDTNILISVLLFPSKHMDRLMYTITKEHQLVLSSYVIDELFRVAERKFKNKVDVLDTLLSQIPYELAYTPKQPKEGLFEIRDASDYPVLYTAIIEDVDVFVTGDKDFSAIDIEKPEILTPVQFLEKY